MKMFVSMSTRIDARSLLKADNAALDQAGNRFIGHIIGKGLSLGFAQIGIPRTDFCPQIAHPRQEELSSLLLFRFLE